jgi:hypothetical protein
MEINGGALGIELLSLRCEWETKLSEWRSSGKSGMSWCRESGVEYHRFLYWRKRLDRPDAVGVGFVEAEITDDHPGSAGIGLECGGVKIEVARGFDGELLAEVVRVLRRA